MSERKVFRRDDDGHWYLIPHDSVDDFYEWLGFIEKKWSQGNDDAEWTGVDYEQYRSLAPQFYIILDYTEDD